MKTTPLGVLSTEVIENKIFTIRGLKVLLDKDIAALYGVSTKRLKEQVNRNSTRFPDDFMFQLTKKECLNLRSQNATSSWGGSRYLPYVFTELGIAMLSSVLNSERAIFVNMQIMRTFIRIRKVAMTHKELQAQIANIIRVYGRKLKDHDQKFEDIFMAITHLLEKPVDEKNEIWFF